MLEKRLAPRFAYALTAAVIGLALFASTTPSPLYGTYRELWGFSPLVLTLVYGTYAFGVLASLLAAGRMSDVVGRRPVLLAALGTLILTMIPFAFAASVAWLFVARGVQGLATGLVVAAASAALLDLHPRRDASGVGLTNGVASTTGLGLGVLVSAALVQLGPAPRVLPYAVLAGLLAIAFVGVLRMPEPVASPGRLRLTPQRPSVPRAVRRTFFLSGLSVVASWSVGGLFFALGPQLSATILGTPNHVADVIALVLLAGIGAMAQLAFGRSAAWASAASGSAVLAGGMLLVAAAAWCGSSALLLAGAAIGGMGFGVSFLGALRSLSAAIPGEHRAAVMSAFYIVAYASQSLPAILAGVLVTPLGLEPTFELFALVVAGIALLVSAESWRTRPLVPAAARWPQAKLWS